MNIEEISKIVLILFDELRDDKKSKGLIMDLDAAEYDEDIKQCFIGGIKRLRELKKFILADDLESKLQGFI